MKATVQVDMDGLDIYLKYCGIRRVYNEDIIYKTGVTRFLELFKKHKIKATFFLIGKDYKTAQKREIIEAVVNDGHELANHTMNHIFGFRNLSKEKKEKEINDCEKVIKDITGKTPIGFRAPGYDIDEETIKILEDRGYKYDSSVVPTFIYRLLMFGDSLIHKKPFHSHGPKIMWGFAPLKPYYPDTVNVWRESSEKRSIKEIPVTSMPIFRIPFYGTFVLTFGDWIFNVGSWLVKRKKIPINYIFHIADLSDKINGITHSVPINDVTLRYDNIINYLEKNYDVSKTSKML